MRLLTALIFLLIIGLRVDAQEADRPSEPENTPVSIGLVIDNSGSYRTIFERVITSASSVINGLKDGDKAFVVTFVDTPKIMLRQELTDDKAELLDAVENMFIEGGKTALIDAVLFASKYFDEHAKPLAESARILVVITDGDERGSSASIDEAVRSLKGSGIRVLVLGLYDEKIYPKVIDRLVKETDGAKFVPKIPRETPAAVTSLITAIRSN